MIQLTPELIVEEFNHEAENLYGPAGKTALGKNFIQFCNSLDVAPPLPDFSGVLSGKSVDKVIQILANNHIAKQLQWTISPLFDSTNPVKVTSILLIGIDANFRFNLENTKKRAEYFEHIINNVPHSIFWKDKNSVFLGCNERFAKLAMLKSAHEIIGKTDYDLPWSEQESAAYIADDQRVIQSKQAKLNIEESQTTNGEQFFLLTSKVPLYGDNGEVSGVLGIFSDITERKKIERELKFATEQSEAANHGLTLMAGSVVHELRTPLATINLAISSIKKHLPSLLLAYQAKHENGSSLVEETSSDLSFMLDHCVEIIQTEVEASNMFIDMLLLKLAAPKMPTEKMQNYSIRQCVNMALGRYPLTKQERDKIVFENGKDFAFQGDSLLTTHIIFNLLKNALYYIKAAAKGEIHIWLEAGEQINQLHFKDTAKGISPEVIPHIFERFYSTSHGGSGIGLAFCKMTMQLFGGDIRCQSVEGDYTEFVLSFPSLF